MPPPLFLLILLSDIEVCDQRPILFNVFLFEIIELVTSFSNHSNQRTLCVEILFVSFKMLRKFINVLCEKRNLTFSRSGIRFFLTVFGE